MKLIVNTVVLLLASTCCALSRQSFIQDGLENLLSLRCYDAGFHHAVLADTDLGDTCLQEKSDQEADLVKRQAAAGGGVAAGGNGDAQTQTMVWVTTTEAGVVKTLQKPYSQTFSTWDGVVASPTPGTIGLGSITGSVGVVKNNKAGADDASSSSIPLQVNSHSYWHMIIMAWAFAIGLVIV